MVIQIRKW